MAGPRPRSPPRHLEPSLRRHLLRPLPRRVQAWRDSLPPPRRLPALLPWLVSSPDVTDHRKARCVLSSKSSSPHRFPDRRWVISSDDGKASCWLQTSSDSGSSGPVNIDPFTGSGASTPLPRFADLEIKERVGGARNGRFLKRWDISAVCLRILQLGQPFGL